MEKDLAGVKIEPILPVEVQSKQTSSDAWLEIIREMLRQEQEVRKRLLEEENA